MKAVTVLLIATVAFVCICLAESKSGGKGSGSGSAKSKSGSGSAKSKSGSGSKDKSQSKGSKSEKSKKSKETKETHEKSSKSKKSKETKETHEKSASGSQETGECYVETDESLEGSDSETVLDIISTKTSITRSSFISCSFSSSYIIIIMISTEINILITFIQTQTLIITVSGVTTTCTGASSSPPPDLDVPGSGGVESTEKPDSQSGQDSGSSDSPEEEEETDECFIETDESLVGADSEAVITAISEATGISSSSFISCTITETTIIMTMIKTDITILITIINSQTIIITVNGVTVECTGASTSPPPGIEDPGEGSTDKSEKSGSSDSGSESSTGSSESKDSGSGKDSSTGSSEGKDSGSTGSSESKDSGSGKESSTGSSEKKEDSSDSSESKSNSKEKSKKSSHESEETEFAEVETSLKQVEITQEFAQEVLNQVIQQLEVSSSEVSMYSYQFSSACGCQSFIFEMSSSLMSIFQQMIISGSFSITVFTTIIQFLSITIVTISSTGVITASSSAAAAIAAGACFSGDTTLLTTRGPMPMQDVTVNDWVAVVRGHSAVHYEKIWWYIHKVPNQKAWFVQLLTARNNTLELSDNHLIPVVPCDVELKDQGTDLIFGQHSRFAGKIRPGDCVVSRGSDDRLTTDVVVSTTRIQKVGYYSPVTQAGNLMVGNVAASCYSQIEDHNMQHMLFLFMQRFAHDVLGWKNIANPDGSIPKVLKIIQSVGSMFIGAK